MSHQMFVDILGLRLFSGDVQDIPSKSIDKILINTINPNSFTISRRNPQMKKALESTDILIQDGQYFALAPLILKKKIVKKISGTDVFYFLMKKANEENKRVFFLGSSVNTLKKIVDRASIDYPNVCVCTYSPPYKDLFDEEDNRGIINAINCFDPDILFIGMTAPKQEIWSYENKGKVKARILCSIGAVFDWYAGVRKQPGKFWVRIGLEWLVRTIDRPEILKRYPDYLFFFWLLFLNVIHVRKD